MGLYPTIKDFTREKLIALLAFLTNFMDTFDNHGICEGEAVRVLAYLQSDSFKELFKAYNGIKKNPEAHIYHGT